MPLFALLVLLAPYIVRKQLGSNVSLMGAIPKGLVSKGAGFASSAMAARGAGGASAGPSPVAMAALGPAALLTTPQGKAAVAKGLTTIQAARKGDPKAKRKVRATKAKARMGDKKAKRELAALQAAEMVRRDVQEADADFDEDDDFDGDEE